MSQRVREIPLFYMPSHNPLNVMRDKSGQNYDISQARDPCYLYQPNVNPTRDGGVVINFLRPSEYARKKKEGYVDNNVPKGSNPSIQPWRLVDGSGVSFDGVVETQSRSSRYFVMAANEDRFDVTPVEHLLNMNKVKNMYVHSVEEAERLMQESLRVDSVNFLTKSLQRREEQLRKDLKQEKRNELYDDHIYVDDEDVESRDYIAKIRESREDEDNEGIIEFSDDSGDEIEINEEEFPIDLDAEEDIEDLAEAGEAKKKERVVDPTLTAEKVFQQIVPPSAVKEEDLVRYLYEVQLATQADLVKRFASQLRTADQKDAFRSLVKKRCAIQKKGNIQYYKLKSIRPH